jgi:Chaperone of endosialidase
MKTKLSPVCLVSCVVCLLALRPSPSALCQIPKGFNYQAVARDAVSGNPITDLIDVKIAILSDDSPETVVWEEEHTGVHPDDHGLFSIVVGQGTCLTTPKCFNDIDWSKTPLFIRTQIRYGGSWKNMGSAKLWSVPYAMLADSLGGPLKKLEVVGKTAAMDEALFEVRNKDGQTIFAVYNQGVRIYVDDAAKGPKGGFAIGGFGTAKDKSQPYFIVKPDTVRVYINQSGKGAKGGFAIGGYGTDKTDPQNFLFISDDSVRIYIDNADTDLKGVKGGFAIGGYGTAKGKPQDLLTVSNDSVRIYLDKAASDKGPKGGFAIGGYGTVKGENEEYLRVTRDSTRVYVNENAKSTSGGFAIGGIGAEPGTITTFTSLTPENYFIGHEAGSKISTGKYNSFIGYQSGKSSTTGNSNTFMGYQSGFKNNTGIANLYIGYQAGYSATTGNASQFIGYMSGYSNTTGTVNTFLGTYSGLMNTKGSYNTYVGNNTGGLDSLGKYNAFYGYETGSMSQGSWDTYIGSKSGDENPTGSYNSFLGMNSGGKSTGSNNVFIGYSTGYNSDATGSVYLGYYAGSNLDRSNTLLVANSNTAPYESNALIYGEFDNKLLRINGKLLLPYNSGNSVLTMTTGNGNNIYFKPEADLLRIQSDYTGTPTLLWLDKYGQAGIGSSLSVPNSLYAAYSSGYVGIGTNSPSYVLHVYKSVSNGTWLSSFQNGTTSLQLAYGGGAGIFVNTNNTSSGLYGLDVYNGSSHVLYARNDGNVGIYTSSPGTYNLYVNGTAYSSGGWTGSDFRWKKDIEPLENVIQEIMQLNGVRYTWRKEEFPEMNFDAGTQIGIIAQDVEKIFPELVRTNSDGYKAVAYEKLTAVLVEGIKEQQKIIESQMNKITEQESQIESLKSRIEKIENWFTEHEMK